MGYVVWCGKEGWAIIRRAGVGYGMDSLVRQAVDGSAQVLLGGVWLGFCGTKKPLGAALPNGD